MLVKRNHYTFRCLHISHSLDMFVKYAIFKYLYFYWFISAFTKIKTWLEIINCLDICQVRDVFPTSQFKRPCANVALWNHKPPIHLKSYILFCAKLHVVKQEIDSMLVLSLIKMLESSYSSPIDLVKKVGMHCLCMDYRQLNKSVILSAEPITEPDNIFSRLGGAKHFSKLKLVKHF